MDAMPCAAQRLAFAGRKVGLTLLLGPMPWVPAAARRADRRLVPRWLHGRKPGRVVARTVRQTRAFVGTARQPFTSFAGFVAAD